MHNIKKRAASSLFFLALCSLGSGCTVELDPGNFDDQAPLDTSEDTGVDSGEIVALGEGRGAGEMTGTWLLIHQQSQCVQAIGPIVNEALSYTWELVTFEDMLTPEDAAAGRPLHETHEVCSLQLTELLNMGTTFPDEAAQSVNPIEVEGSYISSLTPGGGFTSGILAQGFGVNLEMPLAETMPADGEDPRVVDGDEDGNPGITLLLDGGSSGASASGCDMYVSQRSVIRLMGTFVGMNLIRGQSTTLTEQVLLGSSGGVCNVNKTIIPNDAHSSFVLVRVDGLGGSTNLDFDSDGTISCDEVQQARNALDFSTIFSFRDPDDSRCGEDEATAGL